MRKFIRLGEQDYDINGGSTLAASLPIVGSLVSSDRGDKVHTLKSKYNDLVDEANTIITKQYNEIAGLTKDITALTNEKNALQQEVKTLKDQIQQKNIEIAVKDQIHIEDTKTIEEQQTEIDELKDQTIKLQKEIDTLKKDISDIKLTGSKVEQNRDTIRDSLDQQDKKNQDLKQIKKQMKADLTKLNQTNGILEERTKHHEEGLKKSSLVEKELKEKTEKKINDLEKSLTDLQLQNGQLTEDRAKFKIQSETLGVTNADLLKTIDKLEKKIEKLENKYERALQQQSIGYQQQAYHPMYQQQMHMNPYPQQQYNPYVGVMQNHEEQSKHVRQALLDANPTKIYAILTLGGDKIIQNRDALTNHINALIIQRDLNQNVIEGNLFLGFDEDLYVKQSIQGGPNSSVTLSKIGPVSISELMTTMVLQANEEKNILCESGFRKVYQQIIQDRGQQNQI